jgi:hypothetical protein
MVGIGVNAPLQRFALESHICGNDGTHGNNETHEKKQVIPYVSLFPCVPSFCLTRRPTLDSIENSYRLGLCCVVFLCRHLWKDLSQSLLL